MRPAICRSSSRRVATKRSASVLLAIGWLGCAKLAGGPGGFGVEETSFGLYERHDGSWRLIETTATVPCRAGVAYGFQAELFSKSDHSVRLPVRGLKFEAPAPGAAESRSEFLTEPLIAPVGESRQRVDAIWTLDASPQGALFDHPVLIRLFDPASYHTYHERTFEIDGCGVREGAAASAETDPARPASRVRFDYRPGDALEGDPSHVRIAQGPP